MQKAAGIDKFNKFGALNTIDSLAGGDVLKYDLIKALPYEVMFVKLMKNKIENDYNMKYSELLAMENKSKK